MTATELVGARLKASGNQVTILSIDQATKDILASHEILVVASPSWEDQGLDGQPLPEVRQFITSLSPADLFGKKIALLGLGDTAYPHFCGAIDVMEALFKKINVSPIIESLRIDKYYSLPDNEHILHAWADKLAALLV